MVVHPSIPEPGQNMSYSGMAVVSPVPVCTKTGQDCYANRQLPRGPEAETVRCPHSPRHVFVLAMNVRKFGDFVRGMRGAVERFGVRYDDGKPWLGNLSCSQLARATTQRLWPSDHAPAITGCYAAPPPTWRHTNLVAEVLAFWRPVG